MKTQRVNAKRVSARLGMKAATVVAALFALVVVFPAIAQDKENKDLKVDPRAAELIEKNIAAIGGREAMAKVTTRAETGTVEGDLTVRLAGWMTDYQTSPKAGSLDRPMPRVRRSGTYQTVEKVPRMFSAVTTVDGKVWSATGSYSTNEGDYGWVNYPGVWANMEKLEKDKFHERSVFDNLLRWRERYRVVEYLGEKTIESKPTVALRFYPIERGTPFNAYYDPATYMVVAEGNTWFKTYYSDYRVVEGIKQPFATTYDANGRRYEIRVDHIGFNLPVDDGFFDPRPKKSK
jgi:hypothetical protein